MASKSEVLEFRVLAFKDPAAAATPEFSALAAGLKSQSGLLAAYFGAKKEDPTLSVLALRWSDRASRDGFANADADWQAGLDALAATSRLALVEVTAADGTGKVAAVIGAPTTELFTGFTTGPPGYVGNVREFLANVEKVGLEGYHGAVIAESLAPVAKEPTDEAGDATMLIIGWDSLDAHIAAKSKPGNPIIANIGLLRGGGASIDMFHVDFKEL